MLGTSQAKPLLRGHVLAKEQDGKPTVCFLKLIYIVPSYMVADTGSQSTLLRQFIHKPRN